MEWKYLCAQLYIGYVLPKILALPLEHVTCVEHADKYGQTPLMTSHDIELDMSVVDDMTPSKWGSAIEHVLIDAGADKPSLWNIRRPRIIDSGLARTVT